MSNVLKALESFGAIDAESEFRADFFVTSTSWDRVRTGERPIIVGRKGTGKTALRFALLDQASGDPLTFARDLTFRDYPWGAHNGVFDPEVSLRSRYLDTWLFLMLVELARLAVDQDQQFPLSQEGAETSGRLRAFLEKNWGLSRSDHREIFRKDAYSLSRGLLAPEAAGIKLGELEWTKVSRAGLGSQLHDTNERLKGAIAQVLRPDARYYLVFDELDLDFAVDSENYAHSLIGLLLAAHAFHQWSGGLTARPTCVVLLREDIYDALEFSDKNKITDSLVERLSWSDAPNAPNGLKRVIDRRLEVLLALPAGVRDPWGRVFSPNGEGTYEWITRRGYLRPRDLIKFSNLCLDEARHRSSRTIDMEHVKAATPLYSAYLQRELSDEISTHYPTWSDWLELLRRVAQVKFQRQHFANLCSRYPELTGGAHPLYILEALFRFSVIGYSRRVPGPSKTQEFWKYRLGAVAFDRTPDHYVIHLGLREYLGLQGGTVVGEFANEADRIKKEAAEKMRAAIEAAMEARLASGGTVLTPSHLGNVAAIAFGSREGWRRLGFPTLRALVESALAECSLGAADTGLIGPSFVVLPRNPQGVLVLDPTWQAAQPPPPRPKPRGRRAES